MLLGALGLLAYFFETQLRQIYLQYIVPQLTVEDQPVTEPPLTADAPPSDTTAPVSDLPQLPSQNPIVGQPGPSATPTESSQPEVIQKAQPPPTPEDSTLPKVGPLNPDTMIGAPQAPTAQDDPIDLSASQSPSIATPIPDEAKPAADALLAFLATENLEEKRKFILGADDPQVAKLISRYYDTNAPGAIPVTAIGFIRHTPNPEVGGGMQSVFMVESPQWEHPIPVMLQETKNGIKLDWIAFTEFKDDWLLKFVETFRTDPARFHVSIRRGHYFGSDVPELENKHCFYILPPQGHFEVAAFVPKNTPLADMLSRELPWGSRNAYVLAEILWREDGQFKWIELTAVPQLNWHIIIEPPPEGQ